jgi:hypothetical protein
VSVIIVQTKQIGARDYPLVLTNEEGGPELEFADISEAFSYLATTYGGVTQVWKIVDLESDVIETVIATKEVTPRRTARLGVGNDDSKLLNWVLENAVCYLPLEDDPQGRDINITERRTIRRLMEEGE